MPSLWARRSLCAGLFFALAAGPVAEKERAKFYIDKAGREAWGIVDPDKEVLVSAMMVGLQTRINDLDGLHDSKTRISVALRKDVQASAKVLGEASLARIALLEGKKADYETHLQAAQEIVGQVAPADQPLSLTALMTAQIKGAHFDAARTTAEKLHAASAAQAMQIAWVFGDNKAGSEIAPLLEKWSTDPVKLVGWMIRAGAVESAEKTSQKISSIPVRAQNLAECALARLKAGDRDAYQKDVEAVISLQPPALVLGKLANAQVKSGDKDGGIFTARKAIDAEMGFDPAAALAEIAIAQHAAGEMNDFAKTMAKFEQLANQVTGAEKVAALYRIAKVRAEADEIQPCIDTINEAEKVGAEDAFGYRADALAALAVAQIRAGKLEEAEKQVYLVKEPAQRDRIRTAMGLELAQAGKLEDSWAALARISDINLRRVLMNRTLPIAAKTEDAEAIDKVVKEFGGTAPAERATVYLQVARGVLGLSD